MTTYRILRGACGALALLALSSAATAACNGGYRWSEVKDGKTVTHYTQQPPEGRASECVSVSTGTRTQVNAGEGEQTAPGAADAKAGAAAEPGPSADGKTRGMQGVPDRDPGKCKQARETKSVLDSHARIREKGEDGEYRYLTPDEIGDQKKLADESIGVYCD